MYAVRSLTALSVVCLVVAAYVFAVNYAVANDSLLVSQQTLPSNGNVTETFNASGIVETACLGASCVVTVLPRYGLLPVYSGVWGDLKWIHRVFMWCCYPFGLTLLLHANRVVLFGLKGEEKSDLLHGLGWVSGVFVVGFLLSFFPRTPVTSNINLSLLIRHLGYVLKVFAAATFGFVAFIFVSRVYLLAHPKTERRLGGIKDKVW